MKKIYFNDKIDFTGIVRDGDKTMVRFLNEKDPHYTVGEIVAVATCYETTWCQCHNGIERSEINRYRNSLGWKNKMFVIPELMNDFIKITNIRTERLQDISNEDCIKEGISFNSEENVYKFFNLDTFGYLVADDPRYIFKHLVNKYVAKGIWEQNPEVVVYEFEIYDMDPLEKYKIRKPFI